MENDVKFLTCSICDRVVITLCATEEGVYISAEDCVFVRGMPLCIRCLPIAQVREPYSAYIDAVMTKPFSFN